jgi:hypothetical protein
LIDDLLAQAQSARKAEESQLDLFADFNGIPAGVDKTEFYQHDQNWSNRMILGDSLQVMASLAEKGFVRLIRFTSLNSKAISTGKPLERNIYECLCLSY